MKGSRWNAEESKWDAGVGSPDLVGKKGESKFLLVEKRQLITVDTNASPMKDELIQGVLPHCG
jgi:hypothetical protein